MKSLDATMGSACMMRNGSELPKSRGNALIAAAPRLYCPPSLP